MALPIQPKDSGSSAPTIFWWDNFDRFIDTGTGGGSIHNTPGIAFQEQSADTVRRQESSINRSKRTSLANEQGPPLKRFKIDPKRNPAIFSAGNDGSSDSEGVSYSSNVLYLWKIIRKINEKDQFYSKFCGFVIDLIKAEQKKTVMTYLPPIETPITDYGSLFEMFYRSEKMAAQGNMKYTHITLDCGAAMKAYHVLWNNPDRFKHIIIHLGDFHTMQAYFGAIGSYVSGSGFEDIIYQLGLCQPGTMKALLKGKHYNQAWMIHEFFAEAISRMFIEDYVPQQLLENINIENSDVRNLLEDTAFQKYVKYYTNVIEEGLSGKFGKTAQFWLKYVLLVDILQKLHFAIQSNDFDEKLICWRMMLPTFFFFDRTHYSRYGSYYVKSMERLEETHPGAKDELMKIGISVRRNDTGIGQAVDLAGEQSYMRSAKTVGGLTHFQTKAATVRKWVLCRPYQAKFIEALKAMTNLDKTSVNVRKCLRPSEILKSNKIVVSIIDCMKTQFTGPFHEEFEENKLYNLVSGQSVKDTIAESVLKIDEAGKKMLRGLRNKDGVKPS